MKIYKSTKGAIVLEMNRNEAADMQDMISTANDCTALIFGVDNSSSCLGDRGFAAATRLLFGEAERLESIARRFEPISDKLSDLVGKMPPVEVTS